MELAGTHLTLATVWFLLWGVLWAVYFALDGFDLGIGTLLPFLGKTETEKRVMLNSMGPFWDGNEVWLIAAGGVTFAAFPFTYAVMFSWLYTPLLLLLFGLIIRGVSMEFRSKGETDGWRKLWSAGVFVGSALPALLIGVAFANIFRGLPFNAEYVNAGGILDLLNPYGLAGGVLFVLLFLLHGSLWLSIKATGDLKERAQKLTEPLWTIVLAAVVLFLLYSWFATKLFDNYLQMPILFVLLLLPVVLLLLTRLFIAGKKWWLAWGSFGLTLITTTMFTVVGLFPALIPGRMAGEGTGPQFSLTIHNSASSALTLKIMLVVALIFVPIVILYQAWA
ncbi:MAG: cytochrome d ubiquinol oxidase subunit II, partial [Desulfovibrionaceae bacterium]